MLDNLLNGKYEGKSWHYTFVKWMWRLLFAGIVGVILLFVALSFTELPSVAELENPKSEQASVILASDQTELGRYYTENRVPVDFNQLSPNLVNALIATEDERYYQHSGIDFKALGRAAVKTGLLGQRSAGGASTITQQLAKLLFTGKKANSFSKRIFQKLKEWIIAVRLERRYTKQEIIAMYLNKFNFINGAYGIKAASEIYFNKPQDSLNIQESAMLVGMLKNPSLYNPLKRTELVQKRREVVLKQMQKNGLVSQTTYDSLRVLPLGLNYTRQTHIDGLAPYFRMELAKHVKEILNKPENYKSDGTAYNIYQDGLKIYTTIDPLLQQLAEETMIEHMQGVQKTFWNRWKYQKPRDPWTYRSGSDLDIPLDLREQSLNRLIRLSDRYQNMRENLLGEVIQELEKEVAGMQFSEDDREIERMMEEARKSGHIARLVRGEIISSSRAAKYRQVMNSGNFKRLQDNWNRLQKEIDEAFNTPVEMKIFAYPNNIAADKNPKGLEKDTTMTPLDSIKYHRMILQTGIMAVEPGTGYVRVWVGGVNHKYFQYDHVRINRQVGSTFKPFVYATAIAEMRFSPCHQVYDMPYTIMPGEGNFNLGEEWTPSNSDGTYTYQPITLKQGLAQSKNTVSVFLMKELRDANLVRDYIDKMGIDKNRVPPAPSICLGSTDLSVLEMSGAYTTFVNNGVYNRPIFVTRIEDKNGRTIFEDHPIGDTALPPDVNYVMLEMLRHAGSGAMWGVESQVGGKTGTTNDYVDGWFMGVTPNLVVGTWVGGEDRWIRFLSIDVGQGAYMAKPFFRMFVKKLENTPEANFDKEAQFYRPPGQIDIELDCSKYENQLPGMEEQPFEDEFFSDDLFGDEESKKKKENGDIN